MTPIVYHCSRMSHPHAWEMSTRGLSLAAVLAVMILAPATDVLGQRLNFRNYTGFNGLPQSQVLGLAQDPDGFIWAGSYGGLTRYDGRRFTTFTIRDGLGANAVRDIVIDGRRRMWVGTLGGGVTVLENSEVVRDLRAPHDLADDYVEDLEICPDGVLWVATDAGITRIENDVPRHFRLADGLPSLRVWQVRCSDRGILRAATDAGVAVFNQGRFEPLRGPAAPSGRVRATLDVDGGMLAATESGVLELRGGDLENAVLHRVELEAPVVDMARGPDGSIWLAARDGVYHMTKSGVVHLGPANGLLTDLVHRVMVDREGSIWFGTDKGISKLVPGPFTAYTTADGLPHNVVRAMAEDRSGALWFGTRDGIAILTGARFTTIPGTALPDARVYALAPLSSGAMLVGTRRGLCRIDHGRVTRIWTRNDGLPGDFILCLQAVPGRGRVWVGTDSGTVIWDNNRIVRPEDQLVQAARPLALGRDAAGRIWIGLRAGGVLIAKQGAPTRGLGPVDGLTDQAVWSLSPDGDGGMWVGTNGDGAFRVNGSRIERLTRKSGLADDFVWQVLRDSRGSVWFFTSQGLDRLTRSRIRHYGRGDGLLDLEGMAGAALEDSRGKLWLASGSGLMLYEPAKETAPVPPPAVFLEDMRSSRAGRLGPGGEISYPPGILSFELAAPFFRDESAIRFRHRLLPIDERWSPPDPNPKVTLAAIGPGQYRLEAMAVDADGRRSAQLLQVPFTVQRPWYESPGFLLGSLLLLIAGAIAGGNWRTRRIKADRERLEQLVALRTLELQRLAVTDELTGTANRRRFGEVLEDEIRRLSRSPDAARLSLLILDLDGFKEVNDTWGHEAGDRLLAAIGRALQRSVRSSDLVARYGGDEFAVILPMTDREGARQTALKLLGSVESVSIPVNGEKAGVTASIGIAVVAPSAAVDREADKLISAADMALYAAKRAGGGRVYAEEETWQ